MYYEQKSTGGDGGMGGAALGNEMELKDKRWGVGSGDGEWGWILLDDSCDIAIKQPIGVQENFKSQTRLSRSGLQESSLSVTNEGGYLLMNPCTMNVII